MPGGSRCARLVGGTWWGGSSRLGTLGGGWKTTALGEGGVMSPRLMKGVERAVYDP